MKIFLFDDEFLKEALSCQNFLTKLRSYKQSLVKILRN
jgi:hypothetical protein